MRDRQPDDHESARVNQAAVPPVGCSSAGRSSWEKSPAPSISAKLADALVGAASIFAGHWEAGAGAIADGFVWGRGALDDLLEGEGKKLVDSARLVRAAYFDAPILVEEKFLRVGDDVAAVVDAVKGGDIAATEVQLQPTMILEFGLVLGVLGLGLHHFIALCQFCASSLAVWCQLQ